MRKICCALMLALVCVFGAACAEGMGYEMLPEDFQQFFSKEQYRSSTFYFPDEYAMWAEYHSNTPWTTFPIAHETDGAIGLHVLSNASGKYELVTCNADLGIRVRPGESVDRLHYWKTERNGVYWETIQISLFSSADPRWRSYCFELSDRENPQAWAFQSVSYQYNDARKAPLSGQNYTDATAYWADGVLTYSYAEMEESLESMALPQAKLLLTKYKADMTPEMPDVLMTQETVDTARHGNGKSLTMRNEPSKEGKTVMQIPNGAQVLCADMSGEWIFVKYKNTYGYVMSKFIAGSKAYMQ